MFNRCRLLLAGLAIVALAPSLACAREAKSPDFTAVDLQSKGLVLLSTSAAKTSRASATALDLERVVMKNGKRTFKKVDTFFMDNPVIKSDSTTEQMNAHWRALEPGEYRLKQVPVNPFDCILHAMTMPFTITAGQLLYLGEWRVAKGEITRQDNYARDYTLFESKSKGEKPAAFTPLVIVPVFEDHNCP